jgi:predicted DsbA family dithiol-disulfide isomerase
MIVSGDVVPLALTLSGGVWIVMGVFVVGLAALIFSYFTDKGTEIRFHPWGDSRGDAPGSLGVGNVGKDRTVDVRTWTRGTSARDRRRTPAASEVAVPNGDPEMLAQLADWRHHLASDYSALSVAPDPSRDHMIGPSDARLQLVVYTDFECPSCQAASLVIPRLRKHFGDELLIVVRHFPIIDAHPVAMLAAEAVEAAGSQGRFWDMYRRIYRSRHPPTKESLHRFAGALRLDLARFDDEMRDHLHARRIREDFESGLQSGVNATPTIYVNGFRDDDEHTYDSLVAALNKPDPY